MTTTTTQRIPTMANHTDNRTSVTYNGETYAPTCISTAIAAVAQLVDHIEFRLAYLRSMGARRRCRIIEVEIETARIRGLIDAVRTITDHDAAFKPLVGDLLGGLYQASGESLARLRRPHTLTA